MSKIKLSHWKERTPEFWRNIGNAALYGLPLLQTVVVASPFSAEIRLWATFVLSFALVLVKMVTKLFKEES